MASNRDAVIFVIDASPSMLKINQSNDDSDESEAVQASEISFRSAVQCASEVMTSKLLSDNSADLIGVMFMGTVYILS
jgi:hypothetical protein